MNDFGATLNSEEEDLNLNFPPEVLKAIEEILPSNDPFDSPNFNAVDYINEKFPAEQSLHHIDDVLEEMRVNMTSIDEDIRTVIRSLTNVEQDGRTSLLYAQNAITELFSRFDNIKERACESESRVKEITRDIKQLDIAKRNLTASITTLNHLQMLVEGVDKLSVLKLKREYGEVAALLQGVTNVLEHLDKYMHISQVADLAGQVEQIRSDLEKQIVDDFKTSLRGAGAVRRLAPCKELAEACLVVSVLDPRVKRTIISEVTKTQLAEYEALFAGGEADGGLAAVEKRRKWFLRCALEFEKTLAAMFPPIWQVPARLALSFCEMTSDQLTVAMQLTQNDLDVATILHAHKILTELEGLLSKKYFIFTNQSLVDTSNQGDGQQQIKDNGSPFAGVICKCFQPFLHVYLQNIDKRLTDQLEKFSSDMKAFRFEHLDAESSNVVPCCGELFTIYKNVLVEYLRLGGGDGLASLAEVMQRHLRQFASKVLRASLPRLAGANPMMPRDLNMKEISAVLAQVQTLWREGEAPPRFSAEDVSRVCAILVSAEYCAEMIKKLQTKLQEKQSATTPVFFTAEEDLFYSILAQSIALLVTSVECQCEPSLAAMPKLNWTPEQTGDQSDYVTAVASAVASAVPIIRHHLHTSRKYFTRFCDKLAATIINKFVQQVYKCRPLNSVGCEQLLLDCHALKAVMVGLPVVGSKASRDPPQTYTRMVVRAMSRAELLLQVVMGEYKTSLELVEKFARLLPDASMADFQKVLELRGEKDKASILELFRRTVSPERQSGASSSARDMASPVVPVTSPEKDMSKIARLERMLKSRRMIS